MCNQSRDPQTEAWREQEQTAAINQRASNFLEKTGRLCPECLSPDGLIPQYAGPDDDTIVTWIPCPQCNPRSAARTSGRSEPNASQEKNPCSKTSES